MKRDKVTITGVHLLRETTRTHLSWGGRDEMVISGESIEVHDGYHTMTEVYEHRIVLFAALLSVLSKDPIVDVWKSKHHSDCQGVPYPLEGGPLPRGLGPRPPCCSVFDGFFVCGIGYEKGKQITYHLPLRMWDDVDVLEIEKAPEYDGHTSSDVLERLKKL